MSRRQDHLQPKPILSNWEIWKIHNIFTNYPAAVSWRFISECKLMKIIPLTAAFLYIYLKFYFQALKFYGFEKIEKDQKRQNKFSGFDVRFSEYASLCHTSVTSTKQLRHKGNSFSAPAKASLRTILGYSYGIVTLFLAEMMLFCEVTLWWLYVSKWHLTESKFSYNWSESVKFWYLSVNLKK